MSEPRPEVGERWRFNPGGSVLFASRTYTVENVSRSFVCLYDPETAEIALVGTGRFGLPGPNGLTRVDTDGGD